MPSLVRVLPILLLLVGAGCSGSAPRPSSPGGPSPGADGPSSVVARYADTTITLSEFEAAYRNAHTLPSPTADSLAAFQDFLEQYVNFRLKVRAAQEAGLDSLPSVQRDLRLYRSKLARPRFMRQEVYGPLVRTLYERRQEEVDVSHILRRLPSNAAPEDTLEAYRQMQQIADSVRRGVPFGALAVRNSDDPSAQREGQRGYRGRLGYVRAGEVVEPFEDRMYSVPPDSVSDVFRTRFGYHLLKVHDRRPAQAPIRLSHIMLQSASESRAPRQFLDSLRVEIVERGADFAALARTHSEHRPSATQGGDLGQIESLRSLPSSFRDAVTQLDSVGAVSPVVETQYGYHLIKLTDREERPSFEEAYDELKERISGRPRVERRKAAVARRVRTEAGARVDTAQIFRHAPVSSLDTLSRPLLSLLDAETGAKDPMIASIGDSTYTLSQLARHVMQTDGGAQLSVGDVLQAFLDEKALRYAQARLEERDPSFNATMREYREGLLAFQFMQDSVWTPAAQDSAGLRETYRQNRDRYRFPERIRTVVLRAPSDSLLTPYSETEGTRALSSRVEAARGDSLITVDTVMVSDGSPDVYKEIRAVADGGTVGPVRRNDRSVLLLRDTRLPPRRKTFAEARSSVIPDHQARYEETVLSRLRRKYNVEMYPERLRRAFDDQ